MNNKKYKILLIDDDQFLVDMYSLKFKEGGLITEVALSSQEGLEKIRNLEFDIIMLDLIMPVMDGFDLLEKIRKEKLAKKSAIIILSNQGQKIDIERAKKSNIDGYIIKANTIPSEVLNMVLKIADKKFGR